ncbi:MAG: YihY/virulence factor BrkB family protein [Candidatus Dormibacteria bacterium]
MKDRFMRSFVGRVLTRYGEAKGGTWSKVVAWNAILSFFPLVLVTVTLLGLVLRSLDPNIASQVEDAVAGQIAQNQSQFHDIQSAFASFKQKTGIFAVVGVLSLAFSGSALVQAFDQAVNSLYPCKPRGFVAQKIMAAGVILIFTVLTIPLLVSGSLLNAIGGIPHLPHLLYNAGTRYVLQVGLGVLDGAVLFAAIFYIVPYRRQKFRQVLPGAIAGGVLLELFTLVFPLYAHLAKGFSTYGQTFALFFLLLTYFYFLGQILMLSATVNAEIDPNPGKCIEEDPERAGGLAQGEDQGEPRGDRTNRGTRRAGREADGDAGVAAPAGVLPRGRLPLPGQPGPVIARPARPAGVRAMLAGAGATAVLGELLRRRFDR